MAIGCLREVPPVGPGKFFRGGKVEPEIVEQPRCLGGIFLGRCGPSPRRVAKRWKYYVRVMTLIARKPVEQIPEYDEKAL